ncbi:hypothetical protein [Vibrio taketomensis]
MQYSVDTALETSMIEKFCIY